MKLDAHGQLAVSERGSLRPWPEGWKKTKNRRRLCMTHIDRRLALAQKTCISGCVPSVREYDACPACFGEGSNPDSYPSLTRFPCEPCNGVGFFLDSETVRVATDSDIATA